MIILKRLQSIKYRLLLGALILVGVVSPLAAESSLAKLIQLALLQIALIAAVIAVRPYRRLFWLAVSLGVVAFADLSLEYGHLERQINSSALILSGMFFSLLATTFLYDIFRSDEIGADHICGALCVYLMIGTIWTFLYGIIINHDPSAIVFPDGQPKDVEMSGALTYFSFVTLTTLGYGDIRPLTPVARTACWLEAVFGQIYMTVLIARFVGMNLAKRQTPSVPDS